MSYSSEYQILYINNKLLHNINSIQEWISYDNKKISSETLYLYYKILYNLISPDFYFDDIPFFCYYDNNILKRKFYGHMHKYKGKYILIGGFINITNIMPLLTKKNNDIIYPFYLFLEYVKKEIKCKYFKKICSSNILLERLCEFINKIIKFISDFHYDKQCCYNKSIKYSIYIAKISKNCCFSILSSKIIRPNCGLLYIKFKPVFDDATGCITYWKIICINNSPWCSDMLLNMIGFPI